MELGGVSMPSPAHDSHTNVLANRSNNARSHNYRSQNRDPRSINDENVDPTRQDTVPTSMPVNNTDVIARRQDRIPLTERVARFFALRLRTDDEVLCAVVDGSYAFVTALLDHDHFSARTEGVVLWASPIITWLVFEFGWEITTVVSRDNHGDMENLTVSRPTQAVEERARRRSKTRRARGVASPIPRTVIRHQVDYFFEHATQEDIIRALHSESAIIKQTVLEYLAKVAEEDAVSYHGPVTQILFFKFGWVIRGGIFGDIRSAILNGFFWIRPDDTPNMHQPE